MLIVLVKDSCLEPDFTLVTSRKVSSSSYWYVLYLVDAEAVLCRELVIDDDLLGFL